MKSLRLRVTRETINKCLENRPDYPSLLSVSGCLSNWNVPNNGLRVDIEGFNPKEMEYPFIAHMAGKFALIHSIENDKVNYSDEEKVKSTISLFFFLKIWKGVILNARVAENSGQKNYREAFVGLFLKDLRTPLMMGVSIMILLLLFFNHGPGLTTSLLFFSKMMGVTISILLLIQSIDVNNKFTGRLCNVGDGKGCNEILKSEASRINSWLTWSEVGFYYFMGSIIALSISADSILILKWLNLLALPYTVYSLSYQYKRNAWCVLCCSIQVILLMEALFFWVGEAPSLLYFNMELKTIGILALSFLSPVLVWSYLKPLLVMKGELPHVKSQLRSYKYNSDLFNQALKNQPRYAVADELKPIILRNAKSDNTITIVSNPFCGPCSEAHQIVEEWLKQAEDMQVKILFAVKNREDDNSTLTAVHLMSLNLSNDRVYVEDAVNQWYSKGSKDFNRWVGKFPTEVDERAKELVSPHKAWCDMAGVTFTPTIFFNGHKIPEPYKLEDIRNFMS